jgi:DNA-binding IclR family transcriptional regulator
MKTGMVASRANPATARAFAILRYMAERPDDRHTLSSLYRAAGMSKATCLMVLRALVGLAVVTRRSDNSYVLGPANIALRTAALDRSRVISMAMRAINELATDAGGLGVVSLVVGGYLQLLSTVDPNGSQPQPKDRFPMSPPLGTVFAAWWPDERVAQWLGTSGQDLRGGPDKYTSALASVRRRGYAINGSIDRVRVRLREYADSLPPDTPHEEVYRLLVDFITRLGASSEYNFVEVDPGRSYSIGSLSAPVFDRSGEPVLALTLFGLPGALSGAAILELGERLLEAANAVTVAVGGVPPSDRHCGTAVRRMI